MLPARERLSFLPSVAPFILARADLNKHVLRAESASDVLQMMMNAQTYENGHHGLWFLEDYAKLGHDQERVAPTEFMRHMWSDALAQTRLLSDRLAHQDLGR